MTATTAAVKSLRERNANERIEKHCRLVIQRLSAILTQSPNHSVSQNRTQMRLHLRQPQSCFSMKETCLVEDLFLG